VYHFSAIAKVWVGENMIIDCHVNDALKQINQSEYGAHYLLIYPELRVLRELYTQYIKTQLEHENKIVLMLPHYETADNLRKILSGYFSATENAADNTSIDIKKYEDENSFIVIDSLNGHFGTINQMAFVKQLVKRAENSSKSGVLVIADAGPFFHLKRVDELIEHELSMPSKFDVHLKRLCVFHRQDFNILTEGQRQKLVRHHGKALEIKSG
jgi:tRNA G37 N-methylase TrmD